MNILLTENTRRLWFTAALLLGTVCGVVHAAPTVGPEFPVANIAIPALDNQKAAAVAAGGPGYLVVWQDARNSLSATDIYGIFLDGNGNPTSAESFLITPSGGSTGASDRKSPAVAFNGTNFLVVWRDDGLSNHHSHIYGVRVNTSGTVLDATPIAISSTSDPVFQDIPQVASNGVDWEVVWQENASSGTQCIYGARVTTVGTASRTALVNRVDNAEAPAIAWNGVNYIVVWEDYRNWASTGTDIYGVRVTSAGARVGSTDLLISNDSSAPTAGAANAQTRPTVGAVPSGSYLVAWQDARGAGADIYGARVSNTGVLSDNGGIAISTATGDQESPGAGWDGTNLVVTWRDSQAGRTVRGSRLSTTGVVLDTGGLAISGTSADQSGAAIVGGGGSSMVVWSILDTTNSDVHGCKLSSSGNASAEVALCLAMQDQMTYSAAFDGAKYAVAWADNRSGTSTIYVARVAQDGTVLDPTGVQLLTNQAGAQTEPSIARSATGFLVVWSEGNVTARKIRGQFLDANLDEVGTPLEFNTGVTADQYSPSVAWSGSQFLVAWVDDRAAVAPDYYTDIWGARVSSSGVIYAMSAPISNAAHSQYTPTVASDGTNFLVVWQDYRTAQSLYCARVSSTGTLLDSSGVQVSSVVANKEFPKVAFDGTNYLVVWDDDRSGLSNDIYGVRMTTSAARVDANDIPICVQTAYQNSPAVAWTGTDYFVAWADLRNLSTAGADIRLVRVGSNGTVMDSPDILVSGASCPELNPVIAAAGPDAGGIFYNRLLFATHRLAGRVVGSVPPTVTVVDDGAYTSSTSTLHATWSISNPGSGTRECTYAIGTTPGGNEVVNWTSVGTALEVTRTGLSLSNGVKYYLSVEVRYDGGAWSVPGASDGITVDTTPPSTPVVTDDGQYQSTDTLHASWSATDAQSGIALYQYAIGITPGGTELVGWTPVGTATQVTTNLVLSDGVTYYFAVKAQNGAGFWSAIGTSDGITVDASAPSTPTVTDDGVYTSSATSLHATWSASDAQSGISEYQYAIGTTSGGTEIVGWTSVDTATSVTRTGLTLTSGTIYYIAVKAKNGAGLWSLVGKSDGITVDTSGPSTPTVTDDGSYTSVNTSLHASWTASDAQSGITEYQYAIGTTSGGTEIVGWTSTSTATSVTKTGLSLTDGVTYYFAVKALNGAGAWSAVGTSDGIMVDAGAPSTPTVTDDGSYTSTNTSLHATWSAQDTQSGIAEYQYAIGTTSGGTEIVGWTSTSTGTSVTKTGLSLTSGTTYYFAVKAKNGAGIWSTVGTSDGIMVDTSAPSLPTVTDDGVYTSSTTSLHATWACQDAQSGIAEYQYAIGTTSGGTETVGWTSVDTATWVTKSGLSLTSGTKYYFAAKGKNGAGLWSAVGVSDGITVDTSGPSTPVVTDDGVYTVSSSTLHASWSASDSQSGISEYEYAIGTTSGGTEIVGWTSTNTGTSVTKTGLSLADGVTYYFAVQAKNGAGIWSAVGVSDGIFLPHAASTIQQVKTLPNTSILRILGKVATAGTSQLPGQNCFYIEEADRTSGIQVASSTSVLAGDIVSVAGTVDTLAGERRITAGVVQVTASSQPIPRVLGAANRTLGGAALNGFTPGVTGGRGPNNIGLLVRAFGEVTYVGNAGEAFFYIDDGAHLSDGSAHTGVKVYTELISKPALHSFVILTGISSCEPSALGSSRRVLALEMTGLP